MVLTGETEEPPRLDALYDALSPDCFYLELQDRTTRCRDLWEHCGEDTLRGLFLRDLRQRYDAAPEEEKPRLLQAADLAWRHWKTESCKVLSIYCPRRRP